MCGGSGEKLQVSTAHKYGDNKQKRCVINVNCYKILMGILSSNWKRLLTLVDM